MHPNLEQRQTRSILDDESTCRKLAFNQRRNEDQDHTKAIDEAAEGGRFILSTGDQCGRDTPDENLHAMVETARSYGRY